MTAVNGEDIELINKALLNAYCVCAAELYYNELESIRKGSVALERITQVLEDRLNQPTVANNATVDWKSIAEELKNNLSKIHKTAELYNDTAVILETRDAIIKYEQAINKGE